MPTLYFKPLYCSTKLLNTPPISPFLPWTILYSSPLIYFCTNPQYLHDFISYLWSTPCCPSFKILHQIPYGRSTTNCHRIPCSQQAQVRLQSHPNNPTETHLHDQCPPVILQINRTFYLNGSNLMKQVHVPP